jgi:hypothetical protein
VSASLQWVIRSISAYSHMCRPWWLLAPHKSWVSNTLAHIWCFKELAK